jgi:sugar phosphate isomerase/epimerase
MHERMCGTTFIYPGKTLEAGMEFARKFDFHAVDVGIGGINGHMLPTDAARDPIRVAHQVKKAADQHGLELHECFSLNFGPPINDPDPLVQQRTKELFGGLCRFAREAGFEGVMLIPGPVHPQIGQKRSLELAADAFADLLPIAIEHRLRLDVEATWRWIILISSITASVMSRSNDWIVMPVTFTSVRHRLIGLSKMWMQEPWICRV